MAILGKIIREQIDDWATRTLEQLILSIHAALGERPPEMPGYLESEIISNGIRAKIRIDFYEDYETSNGAPIKRQISSDAWNSLNKKWRRNGIKFVAGLWALMLILGGLIYFILTFVM